MRTSAGVGAIAYLTTILVIILAYVAILAGAAGAVYLVIHFARKFW